MKLITILITWLITDMSFALFFFQSGMKRRDAHGNGLIDDGEPFCIFYYEREMRNQSVNDSGGEKRLLSDFIPELRIIICVKIQYGANVLFMESRRRWSPLRSICRDEDAASVCAFALDLNLLGFPAIVSACGSLLWARRLRAPAWRRMLSCF